MSANCWAVIVAAGQGSRMNLKYNKAFLPLVGKPMLLHTLEALMGSGLYDGVALVIRPDERERVRELLADAPGEALLVDGGATRQQSVLNGLRALPDTCRYVAVHDAARPLVTYDILKATLDSAIEFGSGVACTPVTDTIKRVDGDGHVSTLDRSALRAVQTPQVFRLDMLLRAHEWAQANGIEATDDSALIEQSGGNVHLVAAPDGASNIKLTTPADLRYAEYALMGALRTGLGYDAHRLVEGRDLVLCGVKVPYERGLLGHSDADVATHALIDALLGAAGMGDIGRLFPDTDMKYKDICSIELLCEVVRRLSEAGMVVNNCDMTIVAQRPKLAPYIDEMRMTLSRVLGIDVNRINIKGKTTEGMGFEGEGKGISAQCVAAVAELQRL